MIAQKIVFRFVLLTILAILVSPVQSVVATPDQYEPDNSRAAAVNIALGQTQNHSIDPVGDQDWIRFAPPKVSQKYVVNIGNTTTNLSFEVWVKQGLLPEVKLATGTVAKGKSIQFELRPITGTGHYKIGVWAMSRNLVGIYTVGVAQK